MTDKPVDSSASQEALRAFLTDLERLNPDYNRYDVYQAEEQARQTGKSFFAEAASRTAHIIELYLSSPPKLNGGEILKEYYALLESEEKRLITAGVVEETPVPETAPAVSTFALVPVRDVPPLNRCLILNNSHIPELLGKAADAYRRRNEVVPTVIELALGILWILDSEQAETWCLDYVKSHEGHLDPDVIRDMLLVAGRQPKLTRDFYQWIIRWCGDARLLEHWPNVVACGDRILCRHGIAAWLAGHAPRNSALALLALMFKKGKTDDESLLHWLETTLGSLGDCVQRIMALNDADALPPGADFGSALFSELKRTESLFPLVMMAGTHLLSLPSGPYRFAMAVFGLAGEGLNQWDRKLNNFCAAVIRRTFIMDLRISRTPVETIRRLTFGDDAAFRLATAQLDLVTERFDSPKQREQVIEILTPFYASYREGVLLAAEITRRFRVIMRLLHEDYLAQVLSAEQLQHIREDGTVTELSAMVGDARKYLDRRRDMVSSLEKVIASKMDFEEVTRRRRLEILRRTLL